MNLPLPSVDSWERIMRYENSTKNNPGFSLIEIMVAIMILGVAFVGIIQAFPYAMSIIKSAENETKASYLAQEKIEDIFQYDYEDVILGLIEEKHRLGAAGTHLYNFQRKTETSLVDRDFLPTVSDIGYKLASTTVYYTNSISKTEKTYSLTTVIVDR